MGTLFSVVQPMRLSKDINIVSIERHFVWTAISEQQILQNNSHFTPEVLKRNISSLSFDKLCCSLLVNRFAGGTGSIVVLPITGKEFSL